MTTEQLLELKQDIEDTKTTVSELNGQLTTLKKQLKEDWQCNTIKQAEEMLKELDGNISKLDDRIKKGMAKLEDEYNISE